MSHCTVQYVKSPAKIGKPVTAGPPATACSKGTAETPLQRDQQQEPPGTKRKPASARMPATVWMQATAVAQVQYSRIAIEISELYRKCPPFPITHWPAEPVFKNFQGAQESIPPAYVAWCGLVRQIGLSHSPDPPSWESIPGLLKRFTNSDSDRLG
jgi:hypothetical protein